MCSRPGCSWWPAVTAVTPRKPRPTSRPSGCRRPPLPPQVSLPVGPAGGGPGHLPAQPIARAQPGPARETRGTGVAHWPWAGPRAPARLTWTPETPRPLRLPTGHAPGGRNHSPALYHTPRAKASRAAVLRSVGEETKL